MHTPRLVSTLVLLMMMAVAFSQQALATEVSGEAAGQTTPVVSYASEPGCSGYPTPEDAVRGYMTGVTHNDVGAILGATAVEEVTEGYRFDLMVDRLNAFSPWFSLAPADYPFYAELNRHQKEAEVLRQVRNLAYSLLSDVPMDGSLVSPADTEWADTFVAKVNPSGLADLLLVEMRFPAADLEADTRYLEMQATQARIYGADERTERLVLLDLEKNLYMVGFTLMRFGDCWKVVDQSSPIAGLDATGAAQPTTAEEFARLTRGESAWNEVPSAQPVESPVAEIEAVESLAAELTEAGE